MDDDYGPVPWILQGGAADWPRWLDPVSPNRWNQINIKHGPDSLAGKPRFNADTDIAQAVFDTVVRGAPVRMDDEQRRYALIFNGQLIEVPMRPQRGQPSRWFINNAYPNE